MLGIYYTPSTVLSHSSLTVTLRSAIISVLQMSKPKHSQGWKLTQGLIEARIWTASIWPQSLSSSLEIKKSGAIYTTHWVWTFTDSDCLVTSVTWEKGPCRLRCHAPDPQKHHIRVAARVPAWDVCLSSVSWESSSSRLEAQHPVLGSRWGEWQSGGCERAASDMEPASPQRRSMRKRAWRWQPSCHEEYRCLSVSISQASWPFHIPASWSIN